MKKKRTKKNSSPPGTVFFQENFFISQELFGQINGKFCTETYRDVTLQSNILSQFTLAWQANFKKKIS